MRIHSNVSSPFRPHFASLKEVKGEIDLRETDLKDGDAFQKGSSSEQKKGPNKGELRDGDAFQRGDETEDEKGLKGSDEVFWQNELEDLQSHGGKFKRSLERLSMYHPIIMDPNLGPAVLFLLQVLYKRDEGMSYPAIVKEMLGSAKRKINPFKTRINESEAGMTGS